VTDRDGPLVVLGVGNILMRDDGVGVWIVQELLDDVDCGAVDLPAGTQLVDGGTLGLSLLPIIDHDTRALLLIDAVDLDRPPGTVTVLRDDGIEATLGGHLSPHQAGVADLVAVARLTGMLPPAVSLVGVQPAIVEAGLALSPDVERAVARAKTVVCGELAHLDARARAVPA